MYVKSLTLDEFEDTKGVINIRRTDNTMVKRKSTKGHYMTIVIVFAIK